MRTRNARAGAVAGTLFIATLTAGAAAPAQSATPPSDSSSATGGRTDAADPVRSTVAGRRLSFTIDRQRLHVVAGGHARVSGAVRPVIGGLPVALQVRRGGRWRTIARQRTRSRGGFVLSDRRRATASAPVRLRVSGARAGVRSTTRTLGRLEVYRRANASWYGPGLYGNRLGCGGRLDAGTLGVAHKTLPCGTRVTFRKGSRSVRVRVIDRGPFVGGREYDLTAATAQRLGFRGHGTVLATR